MNIQSYLIFWELANDMGRMKDTAERLFTTQQTISYHIQQLEDHYGAKLMVRKPSMRLTAAGEEVFRYAAMLRDGERDLKSMIADIGADQRGTISIGADPFRTDSCIPPIMGRLIERYPNVDIKIAHATSPQLEPMIIDGSVDYAIVVSSSGVSKIESVKLANEQIYLCASESLLERYLGWSAKEIADRRESGVCVADVASLPFCFASNRMGRMIMDLFDAQSLAPKIIAMSDDATLSVLLCFEKIAACFATRSRIVSMRASMPEEIRSLPLHHEGRAITQNVELIYRKGHYHPRYAKFFIELLKSYFAQIENVQLDSAR